MYSVNDMKTMGPWLVSILNNDVMSYKIYNRLDMMLPDVSFDVIKRQCAQVKTVFNDIAGEIANGNLGLMQSQGLLSYFQMDPPTTSQMGVKFQGEDKDGNPIDVDPEDVPADIMAILEAMSVNGIVDLTFTPYDPNYNEPIMVSQSGVLNVMPYEIAYGLDVNILKTDDEVISFISMFLSQFMHYGINRDTKNELNDKCREINKVQPNVPNELLDELDAMMSDAENESKNV